jgi:predicted metal-dependent hydrolase
MQLGLPFGSDARPIRRRALTRPDPPPDLLPSPGASLRDDTLYFVRHRRARRYLLRVDPDGRVRVTIPRGGSQREAEAFAAGNQAWVHRQRTRLVASTLTASDRHQLRDDATRTLPPRLLALAREHGIAVAAVSIRDQRTRWGSCARGGRICLNWRLVLMPAWVADYVMVHELMHVHRMDHSARFWALVARACPAYGLARRWLQAHGPSLR